VTGLVVLSTKCPGYWYPGQRIFDALTGLEIRSWDSVLGFGLGIEPHPPSGMPRVHNAPFLAPGASRFKNAFVDTCVVKASIETASAPPIRPRGSIPLGVLSARSYVSGAME
jgi:hypothetical protein